MPKTKRAQTKKTVRPTKVSKNSDMSFEKLEETLSVYFEKKAPQLPKGVKDVIVSISPWGILLMFVMMIPALFAIFGLSYTGMMGQYMFGWHRGGYLVLGGIFTIALMVLYGLALPGLFKRNRSGWQFMFYAALLSTVRSVVMFDLSSLIIGTLLSMYILFQVRSYYK